MRFLRASAAASAFIFLLWNSTSLMAGPDSVISGRVIFDGADIACEQQCTVTLLASGVRPVQTTLADLSGHFIFNSVPRGFYSVRIDVDGFESVTQSVEPHDGTNDVTIMFPRRRKPNASIDGAQVVNVSEFLDRYPKKAVSLFEKGTESLKHKRNDEAVKFLRNAVELAPTFYEAHNQLGIAYREAGNKEAAEREFLTAHELNSTNPDPLVNLTTLYLDENKPERAISSGEQAVKANSHSAVAFFSLGIALYKAAQLDRAQDALQRALDLAPRMSSVRLMLANVYLRGRQYDKTLEQLNSYIEENPKGEQVNDAKRMRDQLMQLEASNRP